jgi:fumarate hydratase, class I
MQQLRESIHRFVVEAATRLPPDVRRALRSALEREPGASRSCLALQMIAAHVDLADARCAPLCQDTGLPTFEVGLPPCVDPLLVSEAIGEAVVQATEEGKLRRKAVDPVSGRSRMSLPGRAISPRRRSPRDRGPSPLMIRRASAR